MQTIPLNGDGEIEIAQPEMLVPHLGNHLKFVLRPFGPLYTPVLFSKVHKKGFEIPTTAQTFSLVDLCLKNEHEAHCRNILHKFKQGKGFFWTSTEVYWTPEGAFIRDNPQCSPYGEAHSLRVQYEKGDKSVRFVPADSNNSRKSIQDFLKNPYIVAQLGEEAMTEVAERVLKKINPDLTYVLPNRLHLNFNVLSEVNTPTDLSFSSDRAYTLYGSDILLSARGYAFGVHPSEKK